MLDFWDDLEGYASYLFNKSHATTYSLITMITAWLKLNFTEEYFAAYLTYISGDKKKQEIKIHNYTNLLNKKYKIKLTIPDINTSGRTYTPSKKKILYGLEAIQKVGDKAIDTIIGARPYTSLEEFIEKTNEYGKEHFGKKTVNKSAIINLIKAGAFDSINPNRNELINQAYDIRKDKKVEYTNIDSYNEFVCMNYEKEVLGVTLTHKSWLDRTKDGRVHLDCNIVKVRTKKDKNNRLMAFVDVRVDIEDIEVVVFSSQYLNNEMLFDTRYGEKINLTGRKENNKIIFIEGHKIEE